MSGIPLIVGAGPTGLAAALFLARWSVPGALELLESSGVAQAMLAEAHSIHRTLFNEDWRQIAELEFGAPRGPECGTNYWN
jgi:2-polyprenyl-6-methoxyphenol hydroxylase-like FAD-dependent oxidoreductase